MGPTFVIVLREAPAPRTPVVRTEQLFGGSREVILKHGEEE